MAVNHYSITIALPDHGKFSDQWNRFLSVGNDGFVTIDAQLIGDSYNINIKKHVLHMGMQSPEHRTIS